MLIYKQSITFLSKETLSIPGFNTVHSLSLSLSEMDFFIMLGMQRSERSVKTITNKQTKNTI